jgi:hypothetical protein
LGAYNGKSEADVTILKRNGFDLEPLPDIRSILERRAGWVDDRNEIHSRPALGTRSPMASIPARAQWPDVQ